MIILTSFLSIGFVTTSIILCWFTDKYSETLAELESYKRQNQFLQNQNKELREVYKNVLQSYKETNKRNTKAY